MTGDTIIKTTKGDKSLKDLADSNEEIKVYQYDSNGRVVISNLTHVEETRKVKQLIKFTLADNSIIKCTPDHLLLVNKSDGSQSYVEAKNLDIDDDIVKV